MKSFFSFISLIVLFFNLKAQTLCGTANEGGNVVLTAPVGTVFISVTFASYGTPNGSCGSYTIGACHASTSMSVVQAALVGNNSASIPATNGNFGDPCVGTVKSLYIEAVYGIVTPLQLISFMGKINGNGNLLQWETENELNTKKFDIERSQDGVQFLTIGTLEAKNISGKNHYSYTDNSLQSGNFFYRLKMIDWDEKFVYSKIVKITNQPDGKFFAFPNPVSDFITLSNLHSEGKIEIINMQGEVLEQVSVNVQTKLVNMSRYQAGIYFIRYTTDRDINYQRIVKQ